MSMLMAGAADQVSVLTRVVGFVGQPAAVATLSAAACSVVSALEAAEVVDVVELVAEVELEFRAVKNHTEAMTTTPTMPIRTPRRVI